MSSNLESLYRQASDRIAHDFETNPLLDDAHLALVDAHGMSRSLNQDSYKIKSRVPAYYNPNNHTIYLNQTLLETFSATRVLNICYHELIHAISLHKTWREGHVTYFQSGLKLESFEGRRYRCQNRALNEGIVQFLTNANTQTNESAYKNEVAVVTELVALFGSSLIEQAAVKGDWRPLADCFNQAFGSDAFAQFNEHLDNRRFIQAQAMLEQPLTIAHRTQPVLATLAI